MHKYFLSVDIGTSSLKTALFDERATLVHSGSAKFAQNAHAYKEWVSCFVSCVETMREHSNIDAACMSDAELYIAISGQGPSIVYLNKEDEIIFYTSWQSQKRLPLDGSKSYFLPYIRYVQNSMSTLFADVRRILSPAEYLVYTLCEEAVICVPHHAYIPYVFSDDDISRCNIDSFLFPRVVISGSCIGQARTSFAKELFFDYAQVHIVAGGLDYLSALIGAGIGDGSEPVLQRSGTSVVLNAATDIQRFCELEPVQDEQRFVVPHFFADKTNIGYTIPAYNALYGFLEEHMKSMKWEISDMLNFCAQAQPNFVTKYLSPTLHKARPVQAIKAAFEQHGIHSIHHRAGYLVLMIMLQVQSMYEKVVSDAVLSQENTTTLVVSGGHAANTMLMELYAHMLDKTVRTFSPFSCELRGNAALARFAAGKHTSIQEAIRYMQIHSPFRDYKPMDM